jgi:chloramphenicol 3-O phosphotransferase
VAGQVVILNGVPRAGKTSIATALQARLDGVWLNLGVDVVIAMTPAQWRPGIGLRPGGERPDLEPVVQTLYAGLFEAIAAESRAGLNVVADLGLHDAYSRPLGIVADAVRRLAGLPVLLVGVKCPIEAIMARRNADPQGGYYAAGDTVPEPVRRWQEAVHRPGIYDLEVDTSVLSPEACVVAIGRALAAPPAPSAFERLRRRGLA